jgi:hypothetical protein
MHPLSDRSGFAAIERSVERVIRDELAAAPAVVAESLRGIRPRLVFGQHMLTEALRVARLAIDPALLECAKMLAVRRRLDLFLAAGPCELCFQGISETGGLIHKVHSLPLGVEIESWTLPASALDEARLARADLASAYPELFTNPYVSASRYLLGAAM